ncbi:phage portal protein [Paenibacillus apiarius]|uniref:Phage portal protein n=1 Tax=Paenibacillus apiarius TaxID=46240 RepID=A0ABT4DQU6_9BACL|nr:phage portal protein [Paenibacillus apiarius]MCY9513304.1 phage portal protein [Paenibacillus apiarius]MCY9519724.1 phage portal protein [Paenibacillus apiarius]MCY9553220.1 phage portal protein [Paenibacillus apiarius]MCY9557070.1 phage portal protein [Paenibacillus apiarius]MCY9682189.1 phage portal protein [Paenibacillus apiarius]
MAIIRDRDLIDDPNDIPIPLIVSCIKEHQAGIARLNTLDEYYMGEHAILKRELGSDTGLPNNKLVANHAKYITDIAVGYVTGNPVKYEGKQIDDITEIYKHIDIVSHDAELSKDLSIFGVGRELYFMTSDDNPIPKATVIDPRRLFLVVDDTVEYRSMFGVHYYQKRDINNTAIGWKINVYTPDLILMYHGSNLSSFELVDIKSHYFGAVPVVEFWNNEERQGDFEQQISLIDAYNVLMSDRVNDKEQLVDAILKIKGMSLGDDEGQASKTIQLLKKYKVLEMPSSDADADWLTKSLNETEVEVLRNAIKSDIHEFSMVPNLTDENFASNASGVAMKYKLLGLEQLAKNKERYFIQGLRERLKLFANILKVKGKAADVSDVTITMTRNLPANDLETAQMISLLVSMVSNETLISRLSFVNDAEEETDKVNLQKEEDVKRNQKAFGMQFGEDGDDDEEVTDDESAA